MSPGSSPRISSFSHRRRSTTSTRLGEGKLMVNVGSVGQPRDGDNRGLLCGSRRWPGGRHQPTVTWTDRRPTGLSPKIIYRRWLTTLRRRSRRSIRFPSSNRSWAIGSGKDDKLVSSSQESEPARADRLSARLDGRPSRRFFPFELSHDVRSNEPGRACALLPLLAHYASLDSARPVNRPHVPSSCRQTQLRFGARIAPS